MGRLDAQCAYPGLRAAVAERPPNVILRDPVEFGSLAAAVSAGIPHLEVSIGLAEMMVWARNQLTEPLAELDSMAGQPEGRLLTAMATTPVLTSVPASLDHASMEPPGEVAYARRVFRYRAPRLAGGGRLPAPWGVPRHPLVYLTFGSVAAGLGHLTDVFKTALDALADLPVRVLLTTGYSGGIELPPPWPANAHVEKFWPQDEVMPHAAAIVSHGGFGTTMSALSAGVPQILLPLFTTDQVMNARRISEVGAGMHLDGGPAAVAELGSVVPRVLADVGMRSRAADLAAEIALLPSVSEVVAEIERLASRGL